MGTSSIYEDIAKRTGGNVYVGVVGPMRCGKSTFIKKFMETAVIPNITDENALKRAVDELPQSAGGKTVMTTEPKFIPENAVPVEIGAVKLNVKMVDCVGFAVEGAEGTLENGKPREVMTPWSESPIPFEEAAELGTEKVISDHSTVAVMVTTDGSFGELPRENFIPSEERIAWELKKANKPFVIVLNCKDPSSDEAEALAMSLEEKYGSPVALVSCLDINMADIENILGMLVFEFPVRELEYTMPDWIGGVGEGHWLRDALIEEIRKLSCGVVKLSDAAGMNRTSENSSGTVKMTVTPGDILLGEGKVSLSLSLDDALFYTVIEELTSFKIENRGELLSKLCELSKIGSVFEKYRSAINDVERCGYGIVMPSVTDMELDEPEMVKQQGSYGVKLRAGATSIHLIKTRIETEVSPIVGTEKQSEDLVSHLLSEFENDASLLWDSNIFGKSLYELVNEGLHAKLLNMPDESRQKIADTLSRIINEGSQGLICIIL